jgi:hypothetical protein
MPAFGAIYFGTEWRMMAGSATGIQSSLLDSMRLAVGLRLNAFHNVHSVSPNLS